MPVACGSARWTRHPPGRPPPGGYLRQGPVTANVVPGV